MKQSRIDSFLESVTNIGIGFIISMLAWHFLVAPLFGYESDLVKSFNVTVIFTIISILRSYCIRRLFNGKSVYRKLVEIKNEFFRNKNMEQH